MHVKIILFLKRNGRNPQKSKFFEITFWDETIQIPRS